MRLLMRGQLSFLLLVFIAFPILKAQRTYLRADGDTGNTYSLLNSVLGGTAYEVPDCEHDTPHITQEMDEDLDLPVFVFHAHVNEDSDRCQNYDRQRTEIKTYEASPDEFKGFEGDSVSYSWDVKLNADFKPSTAFTHIFQVKAVDGDDSQPFITITPRLKSSGSTTLQIIYSGEDSEPHIIWEEALSIFAGKWIHVVTEYTCELGGRLHLRIKDKETNEQLLAVTNENAEMWRPGNAFLRPKWGIYRSLNDQNSLRDEEVYFNNFCLSKGEPLCN